MSRDGWCATRLRALVFKGGPMRVLILGGTHFLGPPLVRRLAAAGHRVTVFHRGRTHADLPAGVEHVLGDRDRLTDHAEALRRLRPDVVVDMIAYVEAHARGLREVFRGVAGRAVVLSSGDVYRAYGVFHGTEPGPVEPVPLPEDAPLRGVQFPYRAMAKGPDDLAYHYDKIPVEQAVLGEPALPGTVLRLPMVHGPGDSQHRLYAYLRRMDDGRPAVLLDEGMAGWRCPRGYVEDVAAAIALAVTDGRAAGRVYNVGQAVAPPEADWVRAVGEAAGWKGGVVTVPRGRLAVAGNMGQDLVTDTSRIREELGYREEVSPAEALRRTVAWERANPPAEPPAFDYAAEDRLLAEVRG
jgi:nucleoside-diphosphate-sugar epimerase